MWYPHEKNTIEAIVRQIHKLKLNDKFQKELDFVQTLLPGGDRALIDLLHYLKVVYFTQIPREVILLRKFFQQLLSILNFYKINILSLYMVVVLVLKV